MQSSIQRIGVIGLGHMGSDFASNLMADGFQVKVYDRNEKHAAPFVARGATAAAGLGDLADCEAVLTSLRARQQSRFNNCGEDSVYHDRYPLARARGWGADDGTGGAVRATGWRATAIPFQQLR